MKARRILIVGGGFSGMSAAIELRKHGVAVDLVEIDPEWRNYGAGISLGSATLRAFRQLGLYGLVEMVLFILVLFVGYVYLLKKRALEWD